MQIKYQKTEYSLTGQFFLLWGHLCLYGVVLDL